MTSPISFTVDGIRYEYQPNYIGPMISLKRLDESSGARAWMRYDDPPTEAELDQWVTRGPNETEG